jgi:hypothetical protein
MTPLLVGLLLVAISAAIALWTQYNRKVARLEHSWSRTSGTVLYASLSLGGGFDIDMAYEYRVEGKRYVSTVLRSQATTWLLPTVPRERLNALQAGTSVEVFVNPSDPSEAVIEPGGDPKYVRMMFFIAGLAFLAGVRFIVAGS